MTDLAMSAQGHFAGRFRIGRGVVRLGRAQLEAARSCSIGQLGPTVGIPCGRPDEVEIREGALCHGELYNAGNLSQELKLPAGAPLEVLLYAAWQRWSTGMFSRLDGVFAAAVWDRGQFALYRDPSGLCGLYTHVDGRGEQAEIVFASRPGELMRGLGHAPRLAHGAVHEYLRFMDIAAPACILQGVRAVEPGTALCWAAAAGSLAEAPPGWRAASEVPHTFSAAVDACGRQLEGAVARRLAGSIRPATFLSGGVDSALVCTLASRARRDIVAVTVGFEGARFDEAPLAARIAAHLGISHEVLRFGQEDYRAAFERLLDSLEQPMADPSTPATLLAFEHCHERFDVVLDGTGADEAVGAMPPRHVRLAVQYGDLLPRRLRGAAVRTMRTVPQLAEYTPILDFEHPADTMIRWHGFTRQEIEALCGEPVSFADTAFYRAFARFPRGAHFERYSALMDTMPSDRLSQSALITGMTVRYPYFDAQTNRFLRQLRTDWRWLPGQPKRILRELLARYVPKQIWDLPKHGFDFPLQQFLAADDHALVRKHLLHGGWLDRRLLQADVVRSYARRFMAGDQQLKFRVWALVVLGAWLEKHEELR